MAFFSTYARRFQRARQVRRSYRSLAKHLPYPERLEDRRMLALPSGFVDQIVHSGLNQPVGLEQLPSGDMLILEKGGTIHITDPTAGGSAPPVYLSLPDVDTEGERGLLDVALDADFQNNNYIYVFYHNSVLDKGVISRFEHDVDHAHLSDEVFVWIDPQSLASQETAFHLGGALDVGPDGNLYLAVGDKWDDTNDAQDLSQSAGSIIRVDPSQVDALGGWVDGGANSHLIPDDNPFIDGLGGNLDEIWALGLRNPFSMEWDQATGRLVIAEVGDNIQTGPDASHEDVHVATVFDGGANFGWPSCEGPDCAGPEPANYSPPVFSIQHPDAQAIIGSPVYRESAFPSLYHGAFFLADFQEGWLRYLKFDENGEVLESTPVGGFPFADAGTVLNVVSLEVGTDGALYYVDIYNGRLRRISYGVGFPEIENISADPDAGLPPLTVGFSATVSDPDGDPLSYVWDFGDGNQSTEVSPEHTFDSAGPYSVTLSVSDGTNTTVSDSLEITVGTPPTATIDEPLNGATFRAGDTIRFRGTATDDQAVSNTNQTWTVRFVHNSHFHPELTDVVGSPCSGSSCLDFVVPTDGHDFSNFTGYEITYSVTDAEGLTASDTITIWPEKVDITISTNLPTSTQFDLDGLPRIAPFVLDTAVNFEHTITVPDTTFVDGNRYDFREWSDGTTNPVYSLVVPDSPLSLVAQYDLTGPAGLPSDGLAVHYDAQNGVSTTNGDQVTGWTDLSGNGNDLTAFGDPLLVSNSLNGLNTIAFDGDVDRLERTAGLQGLPTGANDRTAFMVVKYDDAGIGGFAYGSPEKNHTFGLVVIDSNFAVQGWGSSNDIKTPTTANGAGWVVQSALLANNHLIQYKNGVSIDSENQTFDTVTGGSIVVGAEIDLDPAIVMEVAEIVLYGRALTESEQLEVNEYFNYKYFVEGANRTPVASDDTIFTAESTSVTSEVMLNDSLGDVPTTITSVTQGSNGAVSTDGTQVTYTPDSGFVGTDSYNYTITDKDGETSTASVTVNVTTPNAGPKLQTGSLAVSSDSWTTVSLNESYNSMVVVATVENDSSFPAVVTRVRNAGSGNSFEVKLDRADNFSGAVARAVHYVVVEEGVYNSTEHGIDMEALIRPSTTTDHDSSWTGDELASSLSNSYSNPVVLGQVMTYNDPAWSAFWSRGSARDQGVSSGAIYVGKHVGEDSLTTRATEDLGIIVLESGTGTLAGQDYVASVSTDSVDGVDNNGFGLPLSLPDPTVGIVVQTGMDGGNGGWAVLHGPSPLGTTLNVAIDEDQKLDAERGHITEQVAYWVFSSGATNNTPLAVDDTDNTVESTAVTTDVLANDTLGDLPTTITSVTQGSNGSVSTDGSQVTYTPNSGFVGTDSYNYTITDNDGETSTATVTVNVTMPSAGPKLQTGSLAVSSDSWTTVSLSQSYNSMVVVATVENDSSVPPVVTRVRNAGSGNSFELKLDRADNSTGAISRTVHYVVVEEGVYTASEHGIEMEALIWPSTTTDHDSSWTGDALASSLSNTYSNPVVLGQVMTYNDPAWSAFWSRGSARDQGVSSGAIYVGKHVGEDSTTTRLSEDLGVIVLESGAGTFAGQDYVASVSSDSVDGVDNNGFGIPLSLPDPTVGIATQTGMDGVNGGWAVLHGPSPLGTTLNVAIDEDQKLDTERSHTTEEVAYWVFSGGATNNTPLAVDDTDNTSESTAVTTDVLANDSLGDLPTTITSVTQGSNGSVNTDGTQVTYTPNSGFVGTDSYNYTITDNDGETSTATVTVDVTTVSAGPKLQTGSLAVSSDSWTTVSLSQSYNSMVVVTTVENDSSSPAVVTRVRNAGSGNSFELKLDRADNSMGAVSRTVHYVVVEEGVYTASEHGIDMEALIWPSTTTDHDSSWIGDELASSLSNTYSNPVVLGQVMTHNDPAWSAFWSRGSGQNQGASSSAIYVGKHVGEDSTTTRSSEDLGVIVLESGTGTLAGQDYVATVSSDSVDGVDNGGYEVSLSLADPTVGIAVQTGMDGGNGGWAVLHGPSPLGATLDLAIDEDQMQDTERSHATEEVAYWVFSGGATNNTPLAVDDTDSTVESTAVVTDVLANDSLGDLPTTITSVTQGSNGSVSTDGTQVTYTPDNGFVGTDGYNYTITDNDGETSTATVSIDVLSDNLVPLAVDDADNTPELTAVTTDVLTNDSLGDLPTTITSVTQGSNGSVSTDGTQVTYTPDNGFVGTDSYDYTITDNDGETSTATVTVDVGSSLPNPVLDLQIDSGIVLNSGLVSQWQDASIHGNDVFGTGTSQPIYGSISTPSGLDAITFDGTNDRLLRSSTDGFSGLPTGNNERTVILVAQFNDANWSGGGSYGTGGENQTFGVGVVGYGIDEDKVLLQGWGLNNDLISGTSAYTPPDGPTAGWMIVSATLQDDGADAGDNAFLFVNGSQIAAWSHQYETDLAQAASRVVIGEEIAELGHIQMDIAAFLIYDVALSQADLQTIENNLFAKYLQAPTAALPHEETLLRSANTVRGQMDRLKQLIVAAIDPQQQDVTQLEDIDAWVPPTQTNSTSVVEPLGRRLRTVNAVVDSVFAQRDLSGETLTSRGDPESHLEEAISLEERDEALESWGDGLSVR